MGTVTICGLNFSSQTELRKIMDPPSRNPKQSDAELTLASNEVPVDRVSEAEESAGVETPAKTYVSENKTNVDVDPDDVPKQFGRYRIERELGRGGMGKVYLAIDQKLEREVAIKIPFFLGDERPAAVERFRREARAMATTQHPNLCPVYDVGQFEQWHFLTMAYIKGQPLTDKLKQRSLSLFQALTILKKVALALHQAHEAGVIHRDLKPSNIMLNSLDEPIVLDFGLARRESASEVEITQATTVLGSPSYMAPEQVEARHRDVGPATDVYAMGIILYQMLTGRRPFRGSLAAIYGKIVTQDPVSPAEYFPGVPPQIEAICLKAMAKAPKDRQPSAKAFAEELSRCLAGTNVVGETDNHELNEPLVAASATAASDQADDASSVRRSRDAQRRQLTVMICNCDVFDPEQSLSSMDLEDQRDVLESFRRLCEEVTHRFGGTVVQSTGQELLLCFGFPTAYEDAAHRAVRTGLGILDELKVLNESLLKENQTQLSAWAAIHTGMVVAGETSVNESQIDTLSIIGEARTVTSRLEALAEPAQIIISEATHRLVKGFFVCESQGKQKVRGVQNPVELFLVLEESVGTSRVELIDRANLTPLVGRDTELSIIKDRWEHAVEGRGQVVLLIGEAGLGKSRLVREIKEHVAEENPDAPPYVIEWRCSAYHAGSSLFPVTDFFERLLEFSRDDTAQARLDKLVSHLQEHRLRDPEQLAIFAALLSIPPDDRCATLELSPVRQKERTQELLLEWLHEFSSAQPVLFIVEDLHWVDPTTLEILAAHIDQGLFENVLSLFSFRPEFKTPWPSHSHVTQVALTRLTKRQIGELIAQKTGVAKIPPEIIAKLADRTDGVPLFVEEFTTLIEESGALDADRDGEDIASALSAIPATLQDLLSARLDRLDSDPDVVQLGATFGREFTYEFISAAAGRDDDELKSELAKLVDAELLFQKGRPPKSSYIFKHALIQDAAYSSLLKEKRQQFHKQIADSFARDAENSIIAHPELLAHHYTEAGEPKNAVQYWLQAGKDEQQHSANAEAISHLTRGLEVLNCLEETSERDQLELGFQLTLAPVLMAARGWSAPEVGVAIERAQQLVAKFGSVEDQFFVMWGLWGWRVIRADMDICSGIADQIMQLVEQSSDGSELLSEAYWVVGCTAYYKGDFQNGLSLLEKGLALVDSDRERGYALKTGQCCSVMCRSHSALALWHLGRADQALQRAEETILLGKKLDHPFSYAMGLFFRRQVLELCGQSEQAHVSIEEEYKVCHENGFVFFEVHAIFGRGEILLRQGNVEEAKTLFDQGLTMLHATGGNLSMDHPYRNIADAYLSAGLLDEVTEWLERGFDLVDNHNDRGMESEFLRLKGELALAAGDEEGAEQSYQRALQVAQQQQAKSWELRSAMSFAQLKQRQGKPDEARQMLAAVYEGFTEGFETADLVRAKTLLNGLGADS